MELLVRTKNEIEAEIKKIQKRLKELELERKEWPLEAAKQYFERLSAAAPGVGLELIKVGIDWGCVIALLRPMESEIAFVVSVYHSGLLIIERGEWAYADWAVTELCEERGIRELILDDPGKIDRDEFERPTTYGYFNFQGARKRTPEDEDLFREIFRLRATQT